MLAPNAASGGGHVAESPPPRFTLLRRVLRLPLRDRFTDFFTVISYILTKTMWLWLILLVAVVLILFYSRSCSRENMSNEKLLSTLETFGAQGTTKDKDPNLSKNLPLKGPHAPPIDPADSLKASTKSGNSGGAYPQVFGPDVAITPGTSGNTGTSGTSGTVASGYTLSDSPPNDANYEFNPDLKNAFPYSGPPQPFLTDFSKIQH